VNNLETPINPGSEVEFAIGRGELPSAEVYIQYTQAVARYRAELAASQGMTPDELHDGYRTVTAPDVS